MSPLADVCRYNRCFKNNNNNSNNNKSNRSLAKRIILTQVYKRNNFSLYSETGHVPRVAWSGQCTPQGPVTDGHGKMA